MTRYYAGLNEALAPIDSMDEAGCLHIIDSLFGRDRLKYGDGIDELREEVRRQIREDFTDRSDPSWDGYVAAAVASVRVPSPARLPGGAS
jgi:hypothetical protein